MRIGLIVQARLGSKRLPKKILEKIYKTTIIDFILNKLKKSKLIECYILATTKKKEDLILKKFANKNNFFFFTGSKDNVLKRFYSAAKKFKLDIVIRCTGDSPFMNHKIVDKFINFFKKKKLDYLSSILKPSYPLGIHVEIFNFSTLEKAFF
jgi:spore coat polysaccharide biosynthesis protein SpsF